MRASTETRVLSVSLGDCVNTASSPSFSSGLPGCAIASAGGSPDGGCAPSAACLGASASVASIAAMTAILLPRILLIAWCQAYVLVHARKQCLSRINSSTQGCSWMKHVQLSLDPAPSVLTRCSACINLIMNRQAHPLVCPLQRPSLWSGLLPQVQWRLGQAALPLRT